MKDRDRSLKQSVKNAESHLRALQNEEVDAVVGRKGLSLLRLREVEEQLRVSEARYRGIVESQREMIGRWTPHRNLTFVNDAYCRFFNRTRDQVIGRHVFDEVVAEDLPRMEAAFSGLNKKAPYVDIEYRVRAAGGIRWTYWTHQALFDADGRLTEVQSIGRDISQHKHLENQLRNNHARLEARVRQRTAELQRQKMASEALNDKIRRLIRKTFEAMENERRLIAKELHDGIGASLAAIKFSIEQRLVEMDDLPPSASLSFEHILSYLVDTIKETKRISRGLRPTTLDDLGLLTTIRNHTHQLRKIHPHIHFAEDFGIEETDIPEHLKIVIYRVLQEALNNATRHSGGDTIQIILEESKDDCLLLTVRDNGRGFDMHAHSLVNEENWGCGLQNMRDRTEICGGKFDIESLLHKGTLVRFVFPCDTE
ncbi:PAS domain-containing sensor histidine kinase [Desulfatitalea alkaliphila]|uniref:histidine kinase n=1 Tax=Desulfatitalea alkaliphila TaxID=2929485 RepID=A0AA41QZW9_9BACT|nr:PAS domain-containing sensor histidine kinase [Desulfatitalea alkaliphila]MCJ8499011.1 PAS domain-containing sensor histidine kinase [Desulfatitalea alkaliphila]